MRRDARRIVVAYDIADDRRRGRVAKALESYGERVQFSVFVVEIGPVKIARLRRQILSLVAAEDSVMLCDLGRADSATAACEFIGRRRPGGVPTGFVV